MAKLPGLASGLRSVRLVADLRGKSVGKGPQAELGVPLAYARALTDDPAVVAARDRGTFDVDTWANQHLSEGLCHPFREPISTRHDRRRNAIQSDFMGSTPNGRFIAQGLGSPIAPSLRAERQRDGTPVAAAAGEPGQAGVGVLVPALHFPFARVSLGVDTEGHASYSRRRGLKGPPCLACGSGPLRSG